MSRSKVGFGFGFFPNLEEQEFFQPALQSVSYSGWNNTVDALVPKCDVNTGLVMSVLRPDKALQTDQVIPWLPGLT